ncbi:MAG: hypothetical protein H0W72_12580 [Planctomycetes bacterium]|nr:hypothetical protein [Planctomycetota bacterium]
MYEAISLEQLRLGELRAYDMAHIEIPPWHRKRLGTPAYDTLWVDVRLSDRRVLRNLVARDFVITGRVTDPDGEGELDFTASDIKAVKRHGALWPWW